MSPCSIDDAAPIDEPSVVAPPEWYHELDDAPLPAGGA